MNPNVQKVAEEAVRCLRERLGENLYSCCLYGSAVRGNLIEGVSDINLLIVVNSSTAEAHQQIAEAIGGSSKIDPFVLGRRGLERSVRAFASKFASIKRNYRVLEGADPLASVEIDLQLERFLCEQGIRNLRLRLVYAFVTRSRNKGGYGRFVLRNITPMVVQFSEALRLNGVSIPTGFEERIPLFEKEFRIDGTVVRDLLRFKRKPEPWSDAETKLWHGRIFPMIDAVLVWIEEQWQG